MTVGVHTIELLASTRHEDPSAEKAVGIPPSQNSVNSGFLVAKMYREARRKCECG
jgi:hypothetical protein